jgi:hapalindole-type alkaloid chlorinase
MSNSTVSEKPAIRILDIHASEVEKYPNTLRDIMFERNFEGMIIREVFPSETVEQVVSRLEDGAMSSLLLSRPTKGVDENRYKPIEIYGQTLIGTSPLSLKEYFDCGITFQEECSSLFQGHLDFKKQIETVLTSLCNGLPVEVPKGLKECETYTPATIRVLFEGNEMPIHAGNQLVDIPQSKHLNTLIDTTDQFSYFIPITVPETGGELIIYDMEWNPEENSEEKALNLMFEQNCKSVSVAPNPGDMLVFDGGRYYHRVTPVSGNLPRRTIGGFMAFSKQHDKLYYWS